MPIRVREEVVEDLKAWVSNPNCDVYFPKNEF